MQKKVAQSLVADTLNRWKAAVPSLVTYLIQFTRLSGRRILHAVEATKDESPIPSTVLLAWASEVGMKAVESMLLEFAQESGTTRKLLMLLPTDKLDWRPHPKARTLGELAAHIAAVQLSIPVAVQKPTYDFSSGRAGGVVPKDTPGIVALFDANVAEARRLLQGMSDEDWMSLWEGTAGGRTVISAPRIGVLRAVLFNHTIHHRGQLSVYLRQLDIAIPSIYGPSADENPFL